MRLTPASTSLRFVSGNWFGCVWVDIQTSWYVIQPALSVNRILENVMVGRATRGTRHQRRGNRYSDCIARDQNPPGQGPKCSRLTGQAPWPRPEPQYLPRSPLRAP